MRLGTNFVYKLPLYIDDEYNSVQVVNTYLPSFVTYLDRAYKISPISHKNDLGGSFKVKAYLTDSLLKYEFSFTIKVYNLPPYLKNEPTN